jgi:hypothetical protein
MAQACSCRCFAAAAALAAASAATTAAYDQQLKQCERQRGNQHFKAGAMAS